jgi:phage terminase small subunit
MPRRSAVSLETPVNRPSTSPQPRADCAPTVAALFREIVQMCPQGQFAPADATLLERYCEATQLAQEAFAHLQSEGSVVDGKSNPWASVWERAAKNAGTLAARLRLAPGARADARTALRKANVPRPSVYDMMQGEAWRG